MIPSVLCFLFRRYIMKLAKVILITVAVTLLALFVLSLLGTVFTILKFAFWTTLLIAVIALAIKLLKGVSASSKKQSYNPKELESWDKMFEEYKQNSDFKTK